MKQQLDDVRTVAEPSTERTAPARPFRSVVALLLLAVVGAGLWFLTPSHLGGSATYMVTSGTSMLPTHEPGALVVTRAKDEYAVGDIIAFHREEPGDLVMHRIVAVEGDRFVTRGDNNQFVDEFRPAMSDVVGTPWIHVPEGEAAMSRLRSPWSQGIVFGVLAMFTVGAALRRQHA